MKKSGLASEDGKYGLDNYLHGKSYEMSGKITAIGQKVHGLDIGDPAVICSLVACGACPACDRGYNHICQNLKLSF